MERVHELADALNLRAQVLGHLGAGSLVFGENFIAKGFPGIKSHCQVFGVFLVDQPDQYTGEAIYASSWFTLFGLPVPSAGRSQGKIGPVS